jgi:hypothetical protein
MRNVRLFGILLVAGALVALPWVAMQFSEEWKWSPFDFVAAGVLLFGTGLLIELAMRKASALPHRAAFGIALVASLLLVWVNLAVGIIGDDDNPANLMYLGVLAVGFVGAVLARFQPRGMSHALLATALAQALVAAIALAFGLGEVRANVFVNGFFVVLWVSAALLFQRSGANAPKWVATA